MRKPSGYGSVIKLKGNRRKPYQVRVTKGYDKDTGKQIYKYIGYFEKQQEAEIALAEYNANPYDIDTAKITFKQLYDKWSNEHFQKVGRTSIEHYDLAFRYCKEIHNMRFIDIRLNHLQGIIDNLGKPYPTRRMTKLLMSQLFRYAIKNDIVEKEYSKYVDLGKPSPREEKKVFTQKEIDKLFKYVDKLEYVDTVLIMIFTCMRIGELVTIKTADVHLKERYMIGGIKTQAGRDRIIPINKKILPFIEKWYNPNNEFLITNDKGEQMQHQNYRREKFKNIMEKLKMDHTPHECRHTGISLLDSAGANKLCVKRIVGHSSKDITEDVYTHKTIEELIATIDLI